MNDLLANFNKIPLQQKALGLVVLLLVIAGGAWYFFISDDLTAIETHDATIVTQNAKLDELKENARKLAEFKQMVENLQFRLRKAEEQLPKKAEIEKLLRDVAYEAQQSGLSIDLFDPQPEVKQSGFARVPVKMKVKGGYHEIAVFFDRLSKRSRIVNVSEVSLKAPKTKNQDVVLSADYLLTTYRFLESDEVKKKKKKKKKK